MKKSDDGIQRILSLSYGKDSIACLGAIEQLGWPLDRIVTSEVWATDTIQADLPQMVDFKTYADKVILERYGIEVEHYCAMKDGKKMTYERYFYHVPNRKPRTVEKIRGGCHRLSLPQNAVVRYKTQICSSSGSQSQPDGVGAQERSRRIYGFPHIRTEWCRALKIFRARRITGRDYKYCAVFRDRGR